MERARKTGNNGERKEKDKKKEREKLYIFWGYTLYTHVCVRACVIYFYP